jgi:5-methylthioribose kinase
MREIDATTAADYLRDRGRIPPGGAASVRELAGGVSNLVLRVDVAGAPPIVLKQARARLRVAQEWTAPVERIWTETAALGVLGGLLPEGAVPRVLYTEPDDFLFAMTCAPEGATTWKARLMAGEVDFEVARQVGDLLGRIHRDGARALDATPSLADRSLFDALRIDPYYRTVARACPDASGAIEALVAAMQRAADDPDERALVLGDYSPKNILVPPRAAPPVLLDFECAHRGDPAFDLGFCASHLTLKAIHFDDARYLEALAAFAAAYGAACGPGMGPSRRNRAVAHLGACVLARVDGKSPVEYLDAGGRAIARRVGRALLDAADAGADDLPGAARAAIGASG